MMMAPLWELVGDVMRCYRHSTEDPRSSAQRETGNEEGRKRDQPMILPETHRGDGDRSGSGDVKGTNGGRDSLCRSA